MAISRKSNFLTLSLLHHHDTLIVGDIQRQLGVLPAQMSRIIRVPGDARPPPYRLPHQST